MPQKCPIIAPSGGGSARLSVGFDELAVSFIVEALLGVVRGIGARQDAILIIAFREEVTHII